MTEQSGGSKGQWNDVTKMWEAVADNSRAVGWIMPSHNHQITDPGHSHAVGFTIADIALVHLRDLGVAQGGELDKIGAHPAWGVKRVLVESDGSYRDRLIRRIMHACKIRGFPITLDMLHNYCLSLCPHGGIRVGEPPEEFGFGLVEEFGQDEATSAPRVTGTAKPLPARCLRPPGNWDMMSLFPKARD